jgi:tape measure domain-containing protein
MPDFAVTTAFRATDRLSPAFNQMGNAADRFGRRAGRAGDMMRTAFASAGLIGGIGLIISGIRGIVRASVDYENSVSGFTTLLGGSQQAAQQLVQTLQTLGAETPFEFQDLSDATTRLLGFGVVTRETADETLRMLGDLAQGSAERLQGISLVYGQIMSGGKMSAQDFNQLINQQVPIAQGLARVWGVDVTTALRRVRSGGGVMAADVQRAMQIMTSEGGAFHRSMERASQTLSGRFSTFLDVIKMTATTIGNVFMPMMKSALDIFIKVGEGVGGFVQRNQELIKGIVNFLIPALGAAIGLWIAYRTALIITAAVQGAIIAIGWIKYLSMMMPIMRSAIAAQGLWNFLLGGTAFWSGILAAKQWLLNAAFMGFPVVWIILGIMAIIAAGVLLYRNWDVVKEKVIGAATIIWEKIKMIGRGFMTYMLFPINMLIAGVIKLLEIASKIPGVGATFASAAESVRQFQANANAATGATNYFAPNAAQTAGANVSQNVTVNASQGVQASVTASNRGGARQATRSVGAN